MIDSFSSNFTDIVTIRERIENGVKSRKIAGIVPQRVVDKKPHGNFSKKKEGERSVVTASVHPQFQSLMALMSYYPYPYILVAQYQQPHFQYQPQNQNQ